MSYSNDHVRQNTGKGAKPEAEVKPPVKARSYSEIVETRIRNRELEKLAPKTGYPELDHLIKGFVGGHLYSLTGDTNVGKTSIACNFAVRIAKQNKRVLYLALEPDVNVVDYIASVRFDKRFEDLTDDEIRYDDGYITILTKEDGIQTVQDVVDFLENSEDHFDLVVVDHIRYFVTNTQNTTQEESNVVKQLASLSKKNNTAIMMIVHLRKPNKTQSKNTVPSMDDMVGSAAFKQDATEVLIVVRNVNEDDPDGITYVTEGRLLVTKTKCGPNGSVPLFFSERKANVTSPGEIQRKAMEVAQYADDLFRDEEMVERPIVYPYAG